MNETTENTKRVLCGDRLHQMVIVGIALSALTYFVLPLCFSRLNEREWDDFIGMAGSVWLLLWVFATLRSRSIWMGIAGILAIGMVVSTILLVRLGK